MFVKHIAYINAEDFKWHLNQADTLTNWETVTKDGGLRVNCYFYLPKGLAPLRWNQSAMTRRVLTYGLSGLTER